jgi:hypothetical protein
MSSPEIATAATKPSPAQDWLNAVRYWLRGRNGVISLIVLAIVIGIALNWSWLVALGVAPLLITVLPCAAMCALGLCMNKMAAGSRSTGARSVETPKPNARVAPSLEAGESDTVPLLTQTWSYEPTADPGVSVTEPRKPEERS